jgi:hypothetical protein
MKVMPAGRMWLLLQPKHLTRLVATWASMCRQQCNCTVMLT